MNGRSAELSDVLKRRCIDACCVQETKWRGSKSKLIGNGYKLLYHGIVCKNGVGIVLSEALCSRLVNVQRVSDRLMSVKIALDKQPCFNIICAYAPQTNCADAEKETFWDDLSTLLLDIPQEESIHIGADLNGHVGKNQDGYERCHGGFGFGTRNTDGERILDLAAGYDLAVINTFFKKKDTHLITYHSGGHSTQIDYAITRRSHLKYYKDSKVIPGEPLTTQHRLLVTVYRLPTPLKDSRRLTPKLKWRSLNKPEGERLLLEIGDKINTTDSTVSSPNEIWKDFQSFCITAAETHLGRTKSRKGPFRDTRWWRDDSVKAAIAEKKERFKAWQISRNDCDRNQYKESKKRAKVQVAIAKAESDRDMYEELESAKTELDIHRIAKIRHNNTKDFNNVKYIKSNNNNLLTSDKDIKTRWAEYYKHLLNVSHPRTVTINTPRTVIGPLPPVTLEEVKLAVKHMKNNKAVGPDEIPAEIWKRLGSTGLSWLCILFNKLMVENLPIPEAWRNSFLVPFYKGKGDIRDCNNFRAIKLMSHTFKTWERILNNRLKDIVQLTQNQCGFVAGRSTSDAIQAIRILVEKAKANNTNLHMVFIDLEKAFDHVPRELIWEALRFHEVPEQYIALIQDMYTNVTTQIVCPAGTCEKFEICNGVHQGSILSPLLFNVTIDYLTRAHQKPVPWNILYADDVALISDSVKDLQNQLDLWTKSLEENGLRVSRKKTEHMSCLFNGTTDPNSIKLYINDVPLSTVKEFKYLGSIISNDGKIDRDVTHRTTVGWMKWRQLTGVMCDNRMPLKIKGKLYKTAVRPAILYGTECWASTKQHVQKLHTTEMRILRWSAGVTRRDRIRNEYVRGSFKIAPIEEKLKEKRLRWYGHVLRRPSDHMVRVALDLPMTKRGRGRRPATWLTTVQNDLKNTNIDAGTAQNRPVWRKRTRRADPR
ncbi:uncharacterized protein LOC134660405 [Cydia amplana]|uniref:uncharacterized protein LOC134660405 n=1 Tax=Cydia amplana TaxID=1869771 RepID=UPI002FE6BAC1